MKKGGRLSLRMGRRSLVFLSMAVLGLAGLTYATWVEPRWIEVTYVDVVLPGWPEGLHGFRIVQFSDLHLGPHVGRQAVRRWVELANGLAPDLVVLSGDFVYRSADCLAAWAQELAGLHARCGVYAVLGNHDVWDDADRVAAILSGVGIVVLRNEVRPVGTGQSRLWLVGLEDTGHTAGLLGGSFREFQAAWHEAANTLAALLAPIPSEEPRFLLVHNPDFTEMLPEGRIDLALCGHTHGGQVRLPVLGALLIPSCFGQKYAQGLVRGPKALVYVNRGVGHLPPGRFNCRPEITLFTLVQGPSVYRTSKDYPVRLLTPHHAMVPKALELELVTAELQGLL